MTQKDLSFPQRRWLELLKHYELVIDYYPGKANVFADSLSRKSLFSLRAMNTRFTLSEDKSILAVLRDRSIFLQQIFEAQKSDSELQAKRAKCELCSDSDFRIGSDDCLMFQDRVVVDRLTKSDHFIPVHTSYSLDKLSELYITEIVRLHEVPISIISDRDPRFTSRFWKNLQEALHMKLNFSTTIHPETVGQFERMIQVLEDMFRCCVLEFEDPSHMISPTEVEIRPDMTYGEEPIKILAQEVKQLRNKSIALVKVLWQRHGSKRLRGNPRKL
ncbi:DNA/RNA polymerases superfamily protein [Gossypium australe]|uniref:DNA/RNA polymerases superfamily protein n=1 Tax=Gossypium australe TaxID=47621 RepID=A0A5B6UYS9_9ROSI|nr:DNA/RNA polymerases superfamily protein [Gossypium australe]